MATSFLTSSEISNFTGIFSQMFETFSLSRTRTITVFKQPKENISSRGATIYPGYGSESNISNVSSYTIVSGVYPAVIKYVGQQPSETLHEVKKTVPKDAKVEIRVERDCSDFIENGKTEKIVLDEQSYDLAGEREVNSFLGLNYYHYYLKKIT